MIAVSACLAGTPCRYDGRTNANEEAIEMANAKGAVSICPECLGGLPTPRESAEIVGGDGGDVLDGKAGVLTQSGRDVTEAFLRGAYAALALCREHGISKALLKAKSPSCGCGSIYDGTFSRTLMVGDGVTAALLKRNGIAVSVEHAASEKREGGQNMGNNTILVVDDDRNILTIIEMYLKKDGYRVKTCERGDEALQLFQEVRPALMLMDVMLPGMDGWEILGKLRAQSDTPVIMLTAKGDTLDKIQGLDLGADDYIVKPFSGKELLARVKAVLRRVSPGDQDERMVSFDGLQISMDNYSVVLDGEALEMTPKEIELLYCLASHNGKVLTREQLLENVWGFDYFGDSRTIDVHIKRIRQKLKEDSRFQVTTVWGVGYKFEVTKK